MKQQSSSGRKLHVRVFLFLLTSFFTLPEKIFYLILCIIFPHKIRRIRTNRIIAFIERTYVRELVLLSACYGENQRSFRYAGTHYFMNHKITLWFMSFFTYEQEVKAAMYHMATEAFENMMKGGGFYTYMNTEFSWFE